MSVITKLANGVKVVTLNNGIKAAQVGVFTKGSGQEDMADVGTMNMLANCINLTGNPLVQAKTDRARTIIRSIGKDASTGLGRISDAMSKAVSAESVEAARDVAQGQAMSLDDDWAEMADNYAFNTAFMNTPLGRDVMGSNDFINNVSADEIKAALKHLNQGQHMVVAAVGNVDHDKFCEQVEGSFGHLWVSTGLKAPALFTGSEYCHRFDSTNFGINSVLHHVPPPGHKFALEFEVGAEIIGSFDPKIAGNQHSSCNLRARYGHQAGPGMPAGVPGFIHGGRNIPVEFFKCDYKVLGGNAVLHWANKTLGQESGMFDEANVRAMQFMGNMYRRTSEYKLQNGKNNLVMRIAKEMQADPCGHIGQSVQDYGYVRDVESVKGTVAKVTKKTLEHAWCIYFVDQEVASGKVGCTEKLTSLDQLRTFTNPKQTYF